MSMLVLLLHISIIIFYNINNISCQPTTLNQRNHFQHPLKRHVFLPFSHSTSDDANTEQSMNSAPRSIEIPLADNIIRQSENDLQLYDTNLMTSSISDIYEPSRFEISESIRPLIEGRSISVNDLKIPPHSFNKLARLAQEFGFKPKLRNFHLNDMRNILEISNSDDILPIYPNQPVRSVGLYSSSE